MSLPANIGTVFIGADGTMQIRYVVSLSSAFVQPIQRKYATFTYNHNQTVQYSAPIFEEQRFEYYGRQAWPGGRHIYIDTAISEAVKAKALAEAGTVPQSVRLDRLLMVRNG